MRIHITFQDVDLNPSFFKQLTVPKSFVEKGILLRVKRMKDICLT